MFNRKKVSYLAFFLVSSGRHLVKKNHYLLVQYFKVQAQKCQISNKSPDFLANQFFMPIFLFIRIIIHKCSFLTFR